MFIPPSLHMGSLELAGKERIEFSDPGNGYQSSVDEFLNIYKTIYFSPRLAFVLGSSKGLLLFIFQSFCN